MSDQTNHDETQVPADETQEQPAAQEREAEAAEVAADAEVAAEVSVTAEAEAADRLPTERGGLPTRARPAAAGPTDQEALEIAKQVVEFAADKKASDIVLLAVGELTSIADYFVICSGASERQLSAIGDGIVDGLRELGIRPIGREGSTTAHWELFDFGWLIVHVMAPPEREYYQLERLWADAPTVLRVQ